MVVVQSNLTVEVAASFEDAFDQLIRPEEWDTLLSNAQSNVVFLTRQWQQTWWHHFGATANCQLHLLILRNEGGTLVGVAPIFVAHEALPPAKEYKRGELRPEGEGAQLRIVQLVGGKDVADYLDIIAEPAHMEAVWSSVLAFLLTKRDNGTLSISTLSPTGRPPTRYWPASDPNTTSPSMLRPKTSAPSSSYRATGIPI